MTPTDSSPRRRWPLAVSLALLAGGLGVALYLVHAKLRLGYDPTFESACNFGGAFDCDQVQTHPASELFGLPIALFAVPTYLLMAFLAAIGLRGGKGSGVATSGLATVAYATVAHAAYLAFVSATQIGAFCVFCMTLYAVNVGTAILAVVARGEGAVAPVREALGALRRLAAPVVPALGVLLVTAGLTWAGYEQVRTSMAEAEKARVAAELEAARAPVEVAAAGEAAGGEAAAAAGTAAPAAGAEAPAKAAPARREARLTENGWDFFDVPVGPDDYVLGPADAPVTYVAFKDFECGFCRYVANQEKPLKQKYEGKVRWVYKGYPMNADCNYRMGTSRMHEGACRSARAAHCAHEQGRFWAMHDVLFQNQKRFSDDQLRGYAEQVGLDLAAYDACLASKRPDEKIEADVRLAARMRINGTPRIYINGRLVTGSTATDVLDYYIQTALESPDDVQAAAEVPATEASPRAVRVEKAAGPFWIDAFEGSIDGQGRAVSVPNVKPALASWFEAKDACEKAGKRLCTEEEWVSACIGQPAKDTTGNGKFTDGEVVGRMYPYGPFYEQGACREGEDKLSGEAGPTGDHAGCRTPEGVYDMAGNLYEWIGQTPDDAAQIGGDYRSGSSATCRRATKTYGPGIKNSTTGFRCCADAEPKEVAGAGAVTDTSIPDVVGGRVPEDLVLDTTAGGKLDRKTFEGKVTYLTFFASWCGNCRKQMPAIKEWQEAWGAKGFQVVGVNVDRVQASGERYIKELEPNFTVALDPSARTMSDFDIDAMPTSFIVGRDGVIKRRVVGYKEEEVEGTRAAILQLLGG